MPMKLPIMKVLSMMLDVFHLHIVLKIIYAGIINADLLVRFNYIHDGAQTSLS